MVVMVKTEVRGRLVNSAYRLSWEGGAGVLVQTEAGPPA